MKQRAMIPYNYKTFTGTTLSKCQIDSYNALQARINQFIAEGRAVPEYLLNGSHNMFRAMSGAK